MTTPLTIPSPERLGELKESLAEVRQRVQMANALSPPRQPVLVAVSKYKPAGDILACYEDGQRDFGENYVQELEDKVQQLPGDIRWHFIGTLQSNKAKVLASLPSLYAVQTLNSAKAATALNKAIPQTRNTPLRVLLQVNTSGEDAKSGLSPLTPESTSDAELTALARHVVEACPELRLEGLMTIGSLTESLSAADKPNADFETLVRTRDLLQEALAAQGFPADSGRWGDDGKLLLSMGMSSDFEAALGAGSDIVRVGTSIFGSRHKKGEATVAQ